MQDCKYCVLSYPRGFFSHLDLKQKAYLRKDCKSYNYLWILKAHIVNIHHFRKGGERFVVV